MFIIFLYWIRHISLIKNLREKRRECGFGTRGSVLKWYLKNLYAWLLDLFILIWNFHRAYLLSTAMHYPDPITTQRQSPQWLYPMLWDRANSQTYLNPPCIWRKPGFWSSHPGFSRLKPQGLSMHPKEQGRMKDVVDASTAFGSLGSQNFQVRLGSILNLTLYSTCRF